MAKRDTYIKGASLLAGGMLIAKVIGAVYRIPLTNIIGAEGIGIYQLVFPVYALLLTLTGSGIPATLSRLIAEKKIQGDVDGAKRLFKIASLLFLIIGIIISLVLFLLAVPLGILQSNTKVINAYRIIAPAILFSTLIATFRGWFQGNMKMSPSAISHIIEQSVKLIAGLTFAYFLMPKGVEYAVYGAILAVVLSEIVTFIVLMFMFLFKHFRKNKYDNILFNDVTFEKVNSKNFIKSLFAVMVPITLGSVMHPLLHFIDSILIINLLKNSGVSVIESTKQYGIFSGPVVSLVNLPVVMTLAFAIVAIPVVSSSRIKRNINEIRAKSAMSVKLTFAIGVPCALALYALSNPIMSLLYPRLTSDEIILSSGLLKVMSVSIILLVITQIYTALLQAIDRAYTPFFVMIFAAAVKIIVMIVLINKIGIYGAPISSIIAFTISALLNIFFMNKWIGKNDKLFKNISTILLSGVIMGLTVILIVYSDLGKLWTLILGIVVGILIYGLSIVLTNTFSREELEGMPMSKVLIKITNFIRFWEKKTNDNSNRLGH